MNSHIDKQIFCFVLSCSLVVVVVIFGCFCCCSGPPSEPQKPVVSKVTSTSVNLKWAVLDMDGSVPILSYQIEMLQEGFDQWQPIVQQPRNYFVVKTLEPSTSYWFRVSAVNEYGFSSPSEISDPVVTKGRGFLTGSPSFRKRTSNTISSNDEVKGE